MEQQRKYTSKDYLRMSPRELLIAVQGFYSCPRECFAGQVRWIGPLAGYASRDARGRQRVGPEYVNFRKIQECKEALDEVAHRLIDLVSMKLAPSLRDQLTFCGIPTGGAAIVGAMCHHPMVSRYLVGLQRETGTATATTRADKEFWFAEGMEPRRGEKVVVIEDVGNGFSTTEAVIRHIEDYGAVVVLIGLFLNRSAVIREYFSFDRRSIPVAALWDEPMLIYDMDDPIVAGTVRIGNYVLNPKEPATWTRLMKVMIAWQSGRLFQW